MKANMIFLISGWTILFLSILFLCFKVIEEFIENLFKNDEINKLKEEREKLLKKIEKLIK